VAVLFLETAAAGSATPDAGRRLLAVARLAKAACEVHTYLRFIGD
jgi:hypothetical protein